MNPNETEMRELDKWIALHVMGWQWWRCDFKPAEGAGSGTFCIMLPPHEKWPESERWNGVKCDGKVDGIDDDTDLSGFRPTTDPAAAFEVLKKCAEKLSRDEWPVQLGVSFESGKWIVHFGCARISEASTLETAICLAAKLLYGGKTT